MTDLDRKIQEISLSNWEQFVQLVGEDAIIRAKTCLLRQDNYSYGEIKNKLGITLDQARYSCTKCDTVK